MTIFNRQICGYVTTGLNDTPAETLLTPTSTHERLLQKALNSQTYLGWEAFQRGILSQSWNECHVVWEKENEENIKMKGWNHYAIPIILEYSNNLWTARCSEMRTRFPEHSQEKLLHDCITLLTTIENNPDIIMTEDTPRIQIQRIDLEKLTKTDLLMWKRITEASMEMKLQLNPPTNSTITTTEN